MVVVNETLMPYADAVRYIMETLGRTEEQARAALAPCEELGVGLICGIVRRQTQQRRPRTSRRRRATVNRVAPTDGSPAR